MSKLRVGVVRGGPSSEYDVSIATGSNVLGNLSTEKYIPVDVFIDRSGKWHIKGVPISFLELPLHIDIAMNCLHGEFGEDGRIQKIFEDIKIPYTGTGPFGSALSMNKVLSREYYKRHGIKIPKGVYIKERDNIEEKAFEIFNSISTPWIVKPAKCGSSIGVSMAKSYDELINGINDALNYCDTAIIEEYVKGDEATCCVVEDIDGKLHALPPIEVRTHEDIPIFSFDAKYNKRSEEICPATYSKNIQELIKNMSIWAHNILGLRHYSRSDFIIHPNKGVHILETNSLPGLTEKSLYIKALESVDFPFPLFLDHLITITGSRD
jgi:D-alanine-D-alanine ligase